MGVHSRRSSQVHMSASPLPDEGQEIEVVCDRVAYGGLGIARMASGATVMLSRGVPGERLRAVVTRQRRKHVEARTLEILVVGPASAAPPWSPLFGTCGGCQLQHMAYTAQLTTKRQWVIDAIARCPGGAAAVLAGADGGLVDGQAAVQRDASPAVLATAALESLVDATVPSTKRVRYRNKATFFFAAREGGLVVGSKAADDPGRASHTASIPGHSPPRTCVTISALLPLCSRCAIA